MGALPLSDPNWHLSRRIAPQLAAHLLAQVARSASLTELRQSAAIFSPHPDDESLACGGTIAKKLYAGANIALIHMTDGGASTDLIPKAELVALRRQESLNAAQALGIRRTVFLEFEDRRLGERAQAAIERVADILAELKPEQVFIPYRREPIKQAADHVAASDIVRAALRCAGRTVSVWEYPVWAWLHWPWVALRQPGPLMRTRHILWNSAALLFGCEALCEWRKSVDVSDFLPKKRAAVAQHRSQVEKIIPHPGYMTLGDVCQGEFFECFFQDREFFRVYDFPVN